MDIRPLGDKLYQSVTYTLLKSEHLQVFRLVLPKGEEFREHKVPGEITVQGLEGVIGFSMEDQSQQLHAGEMLYLNGGAPHAVTAIEDASVLVTVFYRTNSDAIAIGYINNGTKFV